MFIICLYEKKKKGDRALKKEGYRLAAGCIVSYKPVYEALLFNELNESCTNIKLLERGRGSAAFTLEDYIQLLQFQHRKGYIFLQHIHPYQYKIKITGNRTDFEDLLEGLHRIVEHIEPEDKLIAQCRIACEKPMEYSNKELTDLFAEELKSQGFIVDPKTAAIAVSLTILKDHAFLGISELKENLSSWTGGVLFFSREDSVICRAENKLEEAVTYFQIPLEKGQQALDLGAAPGGWTNFLCNYGLFVDAVDPAALDSRVLENKTVTYYPMTAEEFNRKNSGKEYDLIVNDMKMDTNQSIDILCEMSQHLKKDGSAVLTLKLPKHEIQKRIQIAEKVLFRHFAWIRIHQLYYNRSEVTVFMKQKRL